LLRPSGGAGPRPRRRPDPQRARLTIHVAAPAAQLAAIALPVLAATDHQPAALPALFPGIPAQPLAEAAALVTQAEHTGSPGSLQQLPRPLARPRRLLLVGVGAGDEAGWRAAGAALARAARREPSLGIALPADVPPGPVRGLAEGLLLAAYQFRLGKTAAADAPRLRRVTLLAEQAERLRDEVALAGTVAEATCLARDLTNMPSLVKNPEWFAGQVRRAAAGVPGLRLRVRGQAELVAEGFGGILAVGSGSATEPRLVELAWRPRGAREHVVLIGKGITFDSGGISIKTRDGMKLMRKDMAGAAAVVAATLAAARLRLPVRVTALAPLAENMPGGQAWRPGDLVRHYGGQTTEVHNTDAEGRVVLADALAYASRRLAPDRLIDLATLTGAARVALGKQTAALYTGDDAFAGELAEAAEAAGENIWRMPLVEEYRELILSDLADVVNIGHDSSAGSIAAALYLQEFTGTARDCWAHVDMSAPSWADSNDAELVRGATGWGVRTLLRWLMTRTA
jgi:leucyl aminopeptidase